MSYRICEIFYSIQGEGAQVGRPAIFCRFSGCNLRCEFCDTDRNHTNGPSGGEYGTAAELIKSIVRFLPSLTSASKPLVILTGGEPALQIDEALINALHEEDFDVAIETNGTLPLPDGLDWICVSPKAGSELVVKRGNELRLPYPQDGVEAVLYENLEFSHFFLQPVWGPETEQNTGRAIKYCLDHPQWRLSVQLHKLLSIP